MRLDLSGDIAAALQLVERRRSGMVRRVIVKQSDDTKEVRTLQVSGIAKQVNSGVEHLEPFGFSSNPPEGAEALKIEVGGSPAHPLILVAFDRRYRIKNLQPGEAIVFNQWGDYIKFSQDRHIRVVADTAVDVTAPNVNINATTKVTLTTPLVECSQNLKVDGNLEVDGTSDLKGDITAEGNLTAATGTITGATLSGTTDVLIGPTHKSGAGHKHSGVTVGAGNTGGMV